MKAVALLLLALLSMGFAAEVSRAGAQEPLLFEILMPGEVLNTRGNVTVPGRTDSPTLREFLGIITVRANGAICLTADLTTSDSDVLMQLGLQGQASPCTQDGSVVTFNDGQGDELARRMVLQKGTREILANVAPVPPGTKARLGPFRPTRLFSGVPPQTITAAISPPHAGDGGLLR